MALGTCVVIPPPPIPASARAAISSVIFRARPQNRHPRAKIVYAKIRQAFLPKMSLSYINFGEP